VADNIGGGDVQLAALEAKLDAGDSTFVHLLVACTWYSLIPSSTGVQTMD
jgi:hypothetical protein